MKQRYSLQVALAALENLILKSSPDLAFIINTFGNQLLYDYLPQLISTRRNNLTTTRYREFIVVIEKLITIRLGEIIGREVAQQLEQYPSVSTAEHHAIVSHPLLVNTCLLRALALMREDNPLRHYDIVFSFSSVSLSNTSAYPRGFLITGDGEKAEGTLQMPLFPDKDKMSSVLGMRPYTQADIERVQKILEEKNYFGYLSQKKKLATLHTLKHFFMAEDILSAPSFAEQITKLNYRMWPAFFHPPEENMPRSKNASSRNKVPGLIYLEIESVAIELLLQNLSHPSSLIGRLLSEQNFQQSFLRHFNDVRGAFSTTAGWGTHLFWAVNAKNRRSALRLVHDLFISTDGSFQLSANPTAIVTALQKKTIFPSMALCYILIAFYYGVDCLGGLSQITDLPLTKNAWIKVLQDNGATEEIEIVRRRTTNGFSGDGALVAYMKTSTGISAASGIDLIATSQDTSLEMFLQRSKKITLLESLRPMLPDIFRCLRQRPEYKKIAALVTDDVTMQRIFEETGLAQRLY